MKNEIYAIYNTDLDTWLKTYEGEEYRYYHTKQEIDSTFEEYEKDKDKSVESLIVFSINHIIQHLYVDGKLIEEAGL